MECKDLISRAEAHLAAPCEDVFLGDAALLAELLKKATVRILPESRFFGYANVGELGSLMRARRLSQLDPLADAPALRKGMDRLAYTGTADFGHTSADWDAVLSLGLYGLRRRIDGYAERARDPRSLRFYRALAEVWDGVLAFVGNAARTAQAAGKPEMAASLFALTERAPHTLYEAMQTALIYYELQMSFDGTVLRTMGRLDALLAPFAASEEPSAVRGLLDDFLQALDAYQVRANIPFAIAGRLPSGESAVTPFTYEVLRAYLRGETAYVKLHVLVAENTPEELLRLAFEGVCNGKNSIVFLSDERVVAGLLHLGARQNDAMRYHVVGCYECGAANELTCSCNARLNLPMALELALFGGRDLLSGQEIGLPCRGGFEDFEALFLEFERQLRYLADCAMQATALHEQLYPRLHAAPILSATYSPCLESARDLYCHGGARYNNSSLNALGLATAVDALWAIRRLVYEEKRLSLERLCEILASDWAGEEELRQYALRRCPKYGMGDAETDALAARIVRILGDAVVGKQNVRGGIWRLGLFSIDWRWKFGAKTGASADGRHAGDTLSQNTSASFGADRKGLTGHLASVASIDTSLTPNGAIADIDLHRSAAEPQALSATLRAYFGMGGFGAHYNVLDAAILREAQALPERYPNLQVRLCGWNALFRSLSAQAQNELIDRAERGSV